MEAIEQALIAVDHTGIICQICHKPDDAYLSLRSWAKKSGSLITLEKDQYLLPGLIDLHIHAPQWPQLGKALHLPLEDWLQRVTFPLEAKYSDLDFARTMYTSLVDSLLANGTTTAVYFGTIHLDANKILADVCHGRGQRAFVGKVAMDNPEQCPDFYMDKSSEQSARDTAALIEYIQTLPAEADQLVLPIVTPRFIPSCTDHSLKALGEIAATYDCHIQTHCSESDWEHGYVLARHGKTDTRSLDDFGLLTSKTVLAHSNFIDDADMRLIKLKGSGIAHCPLSNFYFSNAVLPVRRILDAGLNIGMGTDISGGPDPSLLQNCSAAVLASRALEDGVDAMRTATDRGRPASRINFMEAFWMATAGGGVVLGKKVGRFAKDYAFDAMVIDTNSPSSNLMVWPDLDSPEDVFHKIVYNANRSNIRTVWVQGKVVK